MTDRIIAGNRIIVGISGASGVSLSLELLRRLREYTDAEIHLIITDGGAKTLAYETGIDLSALASDSYADKIYRSDEIGEAPASGSFDALGMVIVPCSMKTLAGIASGYCDNLLLRAADVTIKERRKLILVPRECPFSTIHLRNMTTTSELGAVIMPPVPAYYNKPHSIDDINRHIAGKILQHLGITQDLVIKWRGGI